MTSVVMLPGFGGSADQPILKKIEAKIPSPAGERVRERESLSIHRLAPPRLKLTPDLDAYVDWLAGEAPSGKLILIGRSFGGRLAIRLAARRKLKSIVLLGFPIHPPNKPRPLDEAALLALRCPTLIIQGTKDELGPLKILEPIIAQNPHLSLHRLEGAGHSFGRLEKEAIATTAQWVQTHA